jgi:hypothetical protein
MSSEMERVTLNLVPRASRALAHVMELTGDSKTDCVNRALPVYAYIEEVLANQGCIIVQEKPESEPIRLVIF